MYLTEKLIKFLYWMSGVCDSAAWKVEKKTKQWYWRDREAYFREFRRIGYAAKYPKGNKMYN